MEEQRDYDFEIQKLKQENIDIQKEVNLLKTQSIRASHTMDKSNDVENADHSKCLLEIENLKLESFQQLHQAQK